MMRDLMGIPDFFQGACEELLVQISTHESGRCETLC